MKYYKGKGLEELLGVKLSPGREATLSATQQESLPQALSAPEGFGSYGEI